MYLLKYLFWINFNPENLWTAALMKLEEVSLSELPPFYKSILQTWRTVFRVERDKGTLDSRGTVVFQPNGPD